MSFDLAAAEQAAYAPFFGYIGAASAQIFTVFGAAYGTAKSAVGICSMGVMRPELIMKSVIPVIMAGKICVYLVKQHHIIQVSLVSTDWWWQWCSRARCNRQVRATHWRKASPIWLPA